VIYGRQGLSVSERNAGREVKGKDVEEVIGYAMGLEEDSVIFYYQIMEVIKSDRARKLGKAIVAQEKQHVLKFLEIKGEWVDPLRDRRELFLGTILREVMG